MGFCLLSACRGISHEFFLPVPEVLSTFSGTHSVKLPRGKLCSETEGSFSRVRKSLIVFLVLKVFFFLFLKVLVILLKIPSSQQCTWKSKWL